MKKGSRMALQPGPIVANIKEECSHYLADEGIQNPSLFLIDSYRTDTFDFGELSSALIKKATELKREAMILSLLSSSNDVIWEKRRVMEKRIRDVAVGAAMTAVISERHEGCRKEIDLLLEEAIFYTRQFGIDTQSISVLAQMLK
ncbi:hypothetical protein DPMN_013036 [Dreissena polymorpha]|uniref:Uncharacterized protein n=1 Tax=Dreissena polymorpha TaxID=45954 RepID=A0A9D4S3A4_DREPO|nr:hypothetical protein DPMN_013036 [Dreissena polymorpha]